MRKILFFILLLPTVCMGADQTKPFTLSLVSYATVIQNNIAGATDDELSGLGLAISGVFHDSGNAQVAGRAMFASQSHNDSSAIDATTLELSILAGQRLNREGFKWYLGGGIFNEKWEAFGFSETFSGLQLTGGLGYNWEAVALDFWFSLRDSSDYEDMFFGTVNLTAAAGGLALGLRF